MLRLMILLMFCWCYSSAALAESIKPRPKLVWCLDHFPHFHEYEQSNQPTGPSVALMQELAQRVGFELSVTPRTPIARCLKLMEEGSVDLMSNLRYSDERAKAMHLIPYSTTIAESLFMRQGDPRQINELVQLNSLIIATIRHYVYSPHLMQQLSVQSRSIAEVDSIELALEMLLRGRIDAVVAPTLSTADVINNNSSYQHRFMLAPIDFNSITPTWIHIGLSRASSHQQLEASLRQQLQLMVNDGTVQRLYQHALDRQRLLKSLGALP
ncbi:substrate-binding periplasmic protein [Arsukibacterium sp.]|uniref:substrate-binding periplasmic protein n=1 Tax=Arsukibacterium sp. TaxID=1977258 RepID=UPI002FD94C39